MVYVHCAVERATVTCIRLIDTSRAKMVLLNIHAIIIELVFGCATTTSHTECGRNTSIISESEIQFLSFHGVSIIIWYSIAGAVLRW